MFSSIFLVRFNKNKFSRAVSALLNLSLWGEEEEEEERSGRGERNRKREDSSEGEYDGSTDAATS